jgi:hypothetical protein
VQTTYGIGTGVILGGSDALLTAAHVVEDGRVVVVTFQDGSVTPGVVSSRDAVRDLALISIDTAGRDTVPVGDENELVPGDTLLAWGYALDLPGEPSLTQGTFSGLRTIEDVKHIQTDAPLNPGESGGPLFTVCGDLVGIVVGGFSAFQGLNFAVAVSEVRTFIAAAVPQGSGGPLQLSPAETVILFYSLLDRKAYGQAYELLSDRRQQAVGTVSEFAAGYQTTDAVYIGEARELGDAKVFVRIVAQDIINGHEAFDGYEGTWSLVLEAGSWKLDAADIKLVPR